MGGEETQPIVHRGSYGLAPEDDRGGGGDTEGGDSVKKESQRERTLRAMMQVGDIRVSIGLTRYICIYIFIYTPPDPSS